MTSQELQILKNFEEDRGWFHNHANELRGKGFSKKFVAIKNKKVISSNEKVDNLIKDLVKKGENPSYLFIEFVHPEGFTLIL